MNMRKPSSPKDYFEHLEFGKDISEKLRSILLKYDFEESIKWMFPVYSLDGKNLLSIGATKKYVGLWFFQGGLLADELRLLTNAQEGKTKAMRQMRFVDIIEINENIIRAYVDEAIENHKAGREIKSVKPNAKIVAIPVLLVEVLKENNLLQLAFDKLSQSKKNEYSEYITTAKQEATKLRRLKKIIPMIMEGVGMNDKYRKR